MSFSTDNSYGAKGSKFINDYYSYLCSSPIIQHTSLPMDNTAGADRSGFIIWMDEDGTPRLSGASMQEKTTSQFFSSYSRSQKSGDLSFELFGTNGAPGWLYHYIHPHLYTHSSMTVHKDGRNLRVPNASTPSILFFVLSEKNFRPYAVITFENFPRLVRERLKPLAERAYTGWKIDSEKWPLREELEKNGKINRHKELNEETKKYEQSTTWYIPLANLQEYARVTMIDDDPIIEKNEYEEINQVRLAHLKRVANGRHLKTGQNPVYTESTDDEYRIMDSLIANGQNTTGSNQEQ